MWGNKKFGRDLVGDTSDHDPYAVVWLRKTAGRVFRSPVCVLATLLALVGGLFWGPLALAIAPAVYLLMFALTAFDRSHNQAARRTASKLPPALPEPSAFSDDEARMVISRLGQTRQAIRNVILASPVGPGFSVESTMRRIPDLERQLIVLAARLEYISSMLRLARAVQSPPKPESLEAQRREATTAADEALRALEALPAKLAQLQLLRIEACDSRAVAVGREASQLVESVDMFAQELSEIRTSDGEPAAPAHAPVVEFGRVSQVVH